MLKQADSKKAQSPIKKKLDSRLDSMSPKEITALKKIMAILKSHSVRSAENVLFKTLDLVKESSVIIDY